MRPVPSPELRLKRFLYLSTERNEYTTGNPESHSHLRIENVPSLDEILKSKHPSSVCRIVSIVDAENAVPCRDTLFYILAQAVASETIQPATRCAIYTTALTISKNDEDFFKFIKYIGKCKKTISSGVIKLITKYYNNKDVEQLIHDTSFRKGYYGWTHRDLIKLSHFKSKDHVMQVIITYLLKGLNKAEEQANNNEHALAAIQKLEKVQKFRTSNEKNHIIENCKEFQYGLEHVPMEFHKSPEIWECIIEDMNIRDLIKNLVRIYKLGLLKQDHSCQAKVIKNLTDPEAIKSAGLHPTEVLIGLRNFEKGGRAKDPKLIKYLNTKEELEHKAEIDADDYKKPDFAHVEPTKCPNVVSALNKMLMLSYSNVEQTNKRYLIAVSVADNMNGPCISNRNITGLEAAVVIILSLLKSEKNVTVVVYNGPTITPVELDKGGSIAQGMKVLKQVTSSGEQYGAPMDWASTNKKPFDVFINMQYNMGITMNSQEKPFNCTVGHFEKYKKDMNMSGPKLIIMSFGGYYKTDYPESVLDCRGFDSNVPKIMNSFIKNLF